MATRRSRTSRHWLRRFFAVLGPGLTSGAADDDPSGISTYSIAGAQFGLTTLWTALLTIPLMISVQLMCARLGMVTGRGLAGVIRTRHRKWVLWMACLLLIVANVVNIGADLAGMRETTAMITGANAYFFTPLYTALMAGLLFWVFLPVDCERIQMAGTGAVCECAGCISRASKLAGGDSFYDKAARGPDERVFSYAGGYLRHHYLTVFILLACGAGSGRGQGQGAYHAEAKAGSHGQGTEQLGNRRGDGHVVFESDHVFYYSYDGNDVERARKDGHR